MPLIDNFNYREPEAPPPKSIDNYCVENLISNKEVMFNKCIRSEHANKKSRYVDNSSLIEEEQDSLITHDDEVDPFILRSFAIDSVNTKGNKERIKN